MISFLRLLGSLKLAVLLIVALAVVLAVATFLEAARGREYVQWYVYHSSWFVALLGLLGLSVLASALVRFPWGKRRIGFLVTHAGLLVLLAGSILSFVRGTEGQLTFQEGETADKLVVVDRSQLTARWQGLPGQRPLAGTAFVFQPGPVDWPDHQTLDLGEVGGVGLRVLKYYRHARTEEYWVEDQSEHALPAIHFTVTGPGGASVAEDWMVADQFGSQFSLGPIQVLFQRAPIASMLDDFLKPPGADMDKQGLLSAHYEGQTERIPISENVGKKVPLGKSGVSVEIVEYLANARPTGSGRFATKGDEPKNPLLELRVHLPDKQPMRQIAFARTPLVSLDGIHGASCPVKFWFHHPAISPPPGVELLHTPEGKLHFRTASGGKYQAQGTVQEGRPLQVGGDFSVSVLKYLPRARHETLFQPLELARGQTAGPEAAMLVEASLGQEIQEVWLKRNDSTYGSTRISTPHGLLNLSFGYEYLPLDFSLRLIKFTHGLNPGRMGDASFASLVRLVDEPRGIDEEHEISMNQPLLHGRFRFYQSSYDALPGGKYASSLTAAYDPGWWLFSARSLKYLGSLMICAGISIIFYTRSYFFKGIPAVAFRRQAASAREISTDPAQQPGADSAENSATPSCRHTQGAFHA